MVSDASISVRSLDEGDLARLHRLVSEMQEFERQIDPRLLPGDTIAEAYTRAMLDRCKAHGGTVLIATSGEELVGFVGVACAITSEELDQPPGPHALITDLAVTASHRGKGCGRLLLTRAEEYARSRGANEIRIAVLFGNGTAESLYSSEGFQPYLQILRKDLEHPR
jgi:GNAT superfamily N-acetyltransferase